MGLSASQGRLLLLTARRSDLEFRAQQISQKRLILSQQLEEISMEYENATSNRQMKIGLYTGNGSDNEFGTKYVNLTYANLMLGTLNSGMDPLNTGVQAGEKLVTPEDYISESYFRLVDPDGAIVIPDVSMIPKTITETKTTENPAQLVEHNAYLQKIKDKDGNETNTYYAITPETDKDKDGTLAKFLSENNMDISELTDLEYDPNLGVFKINDEHNTPHYFKLDGTEYDNEKETAKFTAGEIALNFVKEEGDIPKTKITETKTYNLDDTEISEGQDGKVTAEFKNEKGGTITYTYFIDPALNSGGTDVAGSKTSPNYLQDCLRNGKYLLEKGGVSQDTKNFEWHSISWDAVAAISDSYYTEDDDAAKAKYDRLQAQIQAQDKKLELELDNIETQRQAVTTEVESVEKVIQENIEGSFNAFG